MDEKTEHIIQITLRGEEKCGKTHLINKLKPFLKQEGYEIEHDPNSKLEAHVLTAKWTE